MVPVATVNNCGWHRTFVASTFLRSGEACGIPSRSGMDGIIFCDLGGNVSWPSGSRLEGRRS
jgi:hypothetical protein